jgi:hypothetical protein
MFPPHPEQRRPSRRHSDVPSHYHLFVLLLFAVDQVRLLEEVLYAVVLLELVDHALSVWLLSKKKHIDPTVDKSIILILYLASVRFFSLSPKVLPLMACCCTFSMDGAIFGVTLQLPSRVDCHE